MYFTLEEVKRMNRLLKKEIKETTEEMNTNNSPEINNYLDELLKHWAKIKTELWKRK